MTAEAPEPTAPEATAQAEAPGEGEGDLPVASIRRMEVPFGPFLALSALVYLLAGPSIWAWRYERIHKIREAVSHMLVLFPFETEIYEKEGIPVTYVGHPLAANIPVQPDKVDARRRLGLPETGRILGVLPGSRSSEVKMLSPRFLQAVQILQDQDPDLTILVPMVNPKRRQEFEEALAQHPIRNVHIIDANTAGIRFNDLLRNGDTQLFTTAIIIIRMTNNEAALLQVVLADSTGPCERMCDGYHRPHRVIPELLDDQILMT